MAGSEIPQSSALSEAHGDSLGELFSRDPEGYSQQDLDRVVGALREQRERWVKAEAEAAAKPKGRQAKVAVLATQVANAEDLGL